MARRYSRDNRGRFTSSGKGATARGGRLRTASGGKRETQTIKAPAMRGDGIVRPQSPKPTPVNAPKRLKFNILYHGTSAAAARSIRSAGFKESAAGLFGKGVYATAQKATAKLYQGASPAMLRLRALAGGRSVATSTAGTQTRRRLSNVRANTKRLTPANQGMYWPQTPSRIAVLPAAVANKLLDRSTGKIRKRRSKP